MRIVVQEPFGAVRIVGVFGFSPDRPLDRFDLHQCRVHGLEEHPTMFRRAKTVRSHASFAERFMLVAAMVAVGFMLTVDGARACPSAKEANNSIGVVQMAERPAAAMSALSRPASADKLSVSNRYCCKGGSDHCGVGCASGICATCLSAIGFDSAMLFVQDDSIRHPLPI